MTSATLAAQASIARIVQRDAQLRAWVHHDPQAVMDEAASIDARTDEPALRGLTVGVKDIFDIDGVPTEYGSQAYRGHVAKADAEVVRRLKAAGAVLVGKTATTEFAYTHPAATVNPHNALHTPGGSSSGSAAAVADGMVNLALGSQTGGSTIRPSAYCGIVGFKPTHGVVPTAGMKPLAPSLDTVGLHARSVRDIRRLFAVLAGREAIAGSAPMRICYAPGPFAGEADAASRRMLAEARDLMCLQDCAVDDLDFGPGFAALNEAQLAIMAHEAAVNLRREYDEHRAQISVETIEIVERGRATTEAAVRDAHALAARWRRDLTARLRDSAVLLTFSAPSEAPLLAEGTGSSLFNRTWTLLGVPAITLPFGHGPRGLPLGIQLIAAPGRDDELLAFAQFVEAVLDAAATPTNLRSDSQTTTGTGRLPAQLFSNFPTRRFTC
jgi:Asp-tRNA(Asn)/Glu-tRNA(Gln) amidotransferase A subunit family amidase